MKFFAMIYLFYFFISANIQYRYIMGGTFYTYIGDGESPPFIIFN